MSESNLMITIPLSEYDTLKNIAKHFSDLLESYLKKVDAQYRDRIEWLEAKLEIKDDQA